jgi:hypothetical protein
LHFATDRFERHIRDVGVVLRDVNGPHGGIDKLCRVTARLRRLLARRIGGKATRCVISRDRGPYRRPWRLV